MSLILMVDDDNALCRSLELQLRGIGHTLQAAGSLAKGNKILEKLNPDLILLDLQLPDGSGLELLQKIKTSCPDIPVIMVTGRQDMQATIAAMHLGAFDYIRKPFQIEDIVLALEKISCMGSSKRKYINTESPETLDFNEIIGANRAIVEVIKQIGLLAKTPVSILITGESGTGKELVAQALHHSSVPDKPFVALNCSAVVPTLFESELFGHEKGSFTGADKRKIGKLEQAQAGIIFLDEVGDMPMEQQAKLLRVLQANEFERIGGLEKIPFCARVVAATNRDLQAMVKAGTFREDLYFRLAVSPINVPPLRERLDDVPLLLKYLLSRICQQLHRQIDKIEDKVIQRLQKYNWPGNIRELENVLTRAVALCQNSILTIDVLTFPPVNKQAEQTNDNPEKIIPLREAEKKIVEEALNFMHWNITHTASQLQISQTTLRKKIADYNISPDDSAANR